MGRHKKEKITKHRMRRMPKIVAEEMAKLRTFNYMRNAAIDEIRRMMRDYDINLVELKKNACE